MSLSISSATSPSSCNHLLVTVDQEGTQRQFRMTLAEVDTLLDSFESPAEAFKALVMLWAAYRRKFARTIVGVVIA